MRKQKYDFAYDLHERAIAQDRMFNDARNSSWKYLLISFILTSFALNFVWWYYPRLDQTTNLTTSNSGNIWLVAIYSFLISISFFITFNQLIKSYWSLIPIGVSVVVGLTFRQSFNFQIALMLVLFSGLMFLLQIKPLGMRSVFGLVSFSVIGSVAVPMAVFFLQHNHVSGRFIEAIFPLMLAFMFFLTPIFIPGGFSERIISLVLGIGLIVYHFVFGVNAFSISGTIIIAFTWVILINLNLRHRYRLPTYTLLLMIDMVFLYMLQK